MKTIVCKEAISKTEYLTGVVNSISSEFKEDRQNGKPVSFAMQYSGTWKTLVTNCGFTIEEAKRIEARYHELYTASDAWLDDQLKEVCHKGYAEVAFGLRVRSPLLAQSTLGTSVTPKESAEDARTVGNALSQSYGLLNSRAMNVVMEKVWNSEFKHDILPVAQIHDAGYYLIKDDVDVVAFANQVITEAMSWQDLPEIQHDQVKLMANLDLFYPDWAHPITLPEKCSTDEIRDIVDKALKDHEKAA